MIDLTSFLILFQILNEHDGKYFIAAGQWPLLKLTEKKYINEKIKR